MTNLQPTEPTTRTRYPTGLLIVISIALVGAAATIGYLLWERNAASRPTVSAPSEMVPNAPGPDNEIKQLPATLDPPQKTPAAPGPDNTVKRLDDPKKP